MGGWQTHKGRKFKSLVHSSGYSSFPLLWQVLKFETKIFIEELELSLQIH